MKRRLEDAHMDEPSAKTLKLHDGSRVDVEKKGSNNNVEENSQNGESIPAEHKKEFPDPWGEGDYGCSIIDPYCLRELRVRELLGLILNKINWHEKYKNETIVSKWKQELEEANFVSSVFSKGAFEFVLKQLAFFEDFYNSNNKCIECTHIDYVYKSDNLIDKEIKLELINQVKSMENEIFTQNKQDWHPNSNEQVLDLVHPSLYCFVFGTTLVASQGQGQAQATGDSDQENKEKEKEKENENKNGAENNGLLQNSFLKHMGLGVTLNSKSKKKDISEEPKDTTINNYFGGGRRDRRGRMWSWSAPHDYDFSAKTQWLPSEFQVSNDGKSVEILSYINNLHPIKYKKLYSIISKIFSKFIPLFEKTLTDLIYPIANHNRVVKIPNYWYTDENGEYSYDYYNRSITLPTLPKAEEFDLKLYKDKFYSRIKQYYSLKGKKLKVIVKMANIIVNNEKDKNKMSYDGGVWHVEGMKNESIVATGIYYYDISSNVTKSHLSFRSDVNTPRYEQGDARGVLEMYGLQDNDPLCQELGSIDTIEDRCIVWPNIMQHKVSGFKLIMDDNKDNKDKEKEKDKDKDNKDGLINGHRKILVFFLIDPNVKNDVISTAQVGPQQFEWYYEEVMQLSVWYKDLGFCNSIVDMVLQYVDWPMRIKDAKTFREDLMKERKYFVDANSHYVFEREFSLCEH